MDRPFLRNKKIYMYTLLNGKEGEQMKERDIRDVAAGKLAYVAKTKEELRKQLQKLGYPIEDIDIVIEEFTDYGYLNDLEYAQSYRRYGERKGWALSRIKRELLKKGVDSNDIEDAFKSMDSQDTSDDEYQRAYTVAAKMADATDLDDRGRLEEKVKARIARRLYGYGYSSDVIYSSLNSLESELRKNQ